MKRPKIGPTGDFPRGKLNADDEGGLQIAIGRRDNVIEIHFGAEITWIGFDPAAAIDFCRTILKHAGVKSFSIEL